jgi:hypothetical protein
LRLTFGKGIYVSVGDPNQSGTDDLILTMDAVEVDFKVMEVLKGLV